MPIIAEFWMLLKESVKTFFKEETHSRGAAISFYATLAMGPVLYICAWVAGLILGNHAADARLIFEIRRVVGRDTALMLQAAISASGHMRGGFWPTIVGAIVLVLTAGGLFVEVQSALNFIWKAKGPPFTVGGLLRSWVESIAMVLGLGVLLCASLLINALVDAFGGYFERLFGIGSWIVLLVNFAVFSTLATLLFAAIYKMLPNCDLAWRDVMVGAAMTTALMLLGEYLIALYLAATAIGHRYGPAGGAFAFLIWIYYSVQVFLLGAEFTKVWSLRHGSPAARAAAQVLRPA